MVLEKLKVATKKKCTCQCEGAEFRVCLYKCKQFFSLNCWKTIFLRIWLYRRRHIGVTVFQLLIPPLILLSLLFFHGTVYTNSNKVEKWTEPKEIEENDLISKICGADCDQSATYIMGYYPESDFSATMVKHMSEYFQGKAPFIKFVAGDHEKDLLKFAVIHHLQGKQKLYIGGLLFHHDKTTTASQPPEKLLVTIRMAHDIPFEIRPSAIFDYSINQPDKYYGFMGSQLGLYRAYEKIVYESKKLKDPSSSTTFEKHKANGFKLKLQSFPIPPHNEYRRLDGHICDTDLVLKTILVLGMTVTVFSIIRAPVSEKESGFKLYTRLMGMPRWAYWMSWVLNEVVIQFFVVIIQCCLICADLNKKTGPLVKYGDISVWIVLLLLYTLASTSFLAFIASFFKRGVAATYTVATLWLLTFYFLDLYGSTYFVNSSRYAKVAMCLIPNGGLIWALTLMSSDASAFDWSVGSVHPLDPGDVSLFLVLVLFGVQFVLYFILTLYTDNIRPGDPEFRQPWNYFFQGIRCGCKNEKVKVRPSLIDNLETMFQRAKLEGTFNVHIAESVVDFEQISKSFEGQSAVDDVNLRIFDGQSTVILGHAGCGKSTLLRLLCGEYYPTSGTAFVKHVDVRRNAYDVQQNLSICMQKSLLCSALTIMDHMILVGRIKGLGYRESKEKAERLLELFDLKSHINYFPEQLIDYEKRRLCIALSLIGENKIILLDEPTEGLEIDMKRHIWDIIRKMGEQKTIIVTTSDIDEAYYLGDRISIMSKGKILAAGSKLLLQRIFETGYHLQLSLQPTADRLDVLHFIQDSAESSADLLDHKSRRISRRMALVFCMMDTAQQDLIMNSLISPNCIHNKHLDNESVCDVTDHFVAPSYLLENIGGYDDEKETENESIWANDCKMVLQLRINEGINFSGLFIALDNEIKNAKIGIIDYKVKLYDLETAFAAIDRKNDFTEMEQPYTDKDKTEVAVSMVHLQPRTEFITSGFYFHLQQLRGLLMKRLLWMIGHWRNTILVQLCVPIILLIITIKTADVLYYSGQDDDIVTINYDLQQLFPKAKIVFKDSATKDNAMVKEYSKYYKDEISSHLGLNSIIQLNKQTFREYQESSTKKRYSIGIHIEDDSLTAKFSTLGFHAAPVSLGLILNASLKYDFPDSVYSMQFNSFPIEDSTNKLLKYYKNFKDPYEIDPAFCYAIMLGFGFFIFVSNFVSQPLTERLSWLKCLQTNTSAGSLKYWVSFFIVDFSLSVVIGGALLLCIIWISKAPVYRNRAFAEHFILYWCLSCYTSIMLSYIFSFHLRRSNTGYYAMLSCNQCAGLFTFVLSRTFHSQLHQHISRTVFRLFQPYLVVSGFYYIFQQAAENSICDLLAPEVKESLCSENKLYQMDSVDQSCCKQICTRKQECLSSASYFKWSYLKNYVKTDDNLTWEYLCLLCHAVVLTIALYVTEQGVTKHFRKSYHLRRKRRQMSMTVEKECELTQASLQFESEKRKELFIMTDIFKVSKGLELANISLVAAPGQLLAICGPSCSGKSALFHILARFRSTNCGNVYYDGESLVSWHFARFVSKIGFCPSNDVSLRKLSGIQMMKLFGRLRGIPEKDLNAHVNEWLIALGLKTRAKQLCELYNNSMKKKLAFALAVIGDPKVIILDDPFKDINPASRFQIAALIKNLLTSNRTIIATTADIKDFEDCCSKCAFLVNGKLESVIIPDGEMREKRIKGYTLAIKLRTNPENVTFNDYAELKNRILKSFPESQLIEEQQYLYKYHIEDKNYKWFALFGTLDTIETDFTKIIQEYYIREMQLEDLYNMYAIKQRKFRKSPESWDVFCMTYC